MGCERWREELSAQLDGEGDPELRADVDGHLAGCRACRQWWDRAAEVNRLTRTGLALPVPDLSAAILTALPAGVGAAVRPRRRAVAALFAGLAVVGAVQLILGLAQIGGSAAGEHAHRGVAPAATVGHLWHESAAWNVAVGAGFLVIGLRRSRPTGLVPMLSAFVGMLLLLSVNDLTADRVEATRLVSHGFVIVGYLIVVALARMTAADFRPPGDRRGSDRGWRLRGESPAPASAVPTLRLVRRMPPPAPASAALRADPPAERRAA